MTGRTEGDERIIRLGVDTINYAAKPKGNALIGAITNRMKHDGYLEVPIGLFLYAVRIGHTWVPSAFKPATKSDEKWGEFVSAELIGLDFDNKRKLPDGGEEKFYVGDPRCLMPKAAFERLKAVGVTPLCVYSTGQATKEHPRYRIIIDLDTPITDRERYEGMVAGLLDLFPEADAKCKGANHLFFGHTGSRLFFKVREDVRPYYEAYAENGKRWGDVQ